MFKKLKFNAYDTKASENPASAVVYRLSPIDRELDHSLICQMTIKVFAALTSKSKGWLTGRQYDATYGMLFHWETI